VYSTARFLFSDLRKFRNAQFDGHHGPFAVAADAATADSRMHSNHMRRQEITAAAPLA